MECNKIFFTHLRHVPVDFGHHILQKIDSLHIGNKVRLSLIHLKNHIFIDSVILYKKAIASTNMRVEIRNQDILNKITNWNINYDNPMYINYRCITLVEYINEPQYTDLTKTNTATAPKLTPTTSRADTIDRLKIPAVTPYKMVLNDVFYT